MIFFRRVCHLMFCVNINTDFMNIFAQRLNIPREKIKTRLLFKSKNRHLFTSFEAHINSIECVSHIWFTAIFHIYFLPTQNKSNNSLSTSSHWFPITAAQLTTHTPLPISFSLSISFLFLLILLVFYIIFIFIRYGQWQFSFFFIITVYVAFHLEL